MNLQTLMKVKNNSKKRLGRGIGSGVGKTAGRGTKGQKARGKLPVAFSGTGLPTYKKLPKRRGLGNRALSAKVKPIKLDSLNNFKLDSVVDLEQLFKQKIINKNDLKRGVKILAEGKLAVSLVIKLPVSKTAAKEIKRAGGKVEYV